MAMFAAKGLSDSYDGWCDGGEVFTKAAWCLTAHLRPLRVVETGVARGVTSRLILEALARNGAGHLYSVDLPPVDSRYHPQAAIAVPEHLRTNWTLLNGTSRHRLPPLLDELGEIDLFVHDSLHTGRNTSFEIDRAWQILRPGGALLIDDVYQSFAFRTFADTTALRWSGIGANPDSSYRFGIAMAHAERREH
jgi:predicted O-methyltransferase YrrM